MASEPKGTRCSFAVRFSDLYDSVRRELLLNVARTSLRTKLSEEVCTLITQKRRISHVVWLSRAEGCSLRRIPWQLASERECLADGCVLCGNVQLAEQMTEAVTDAVMTIAQPGQPIDLHMIEIMSMTHKLGSDSRFVKGLVRRSESVYSRQARSCTRFHLENRRLYCVRDAHRYLIRHD